MYDILYIYWVEQCLTHNKHYISHYYYFETKINCSFSLQPSNEEVFFFLLSPSIA